MARVILTALMLCAPLGAMAADELKVAQLEQDVRDLQRQVQAQSRQIDELRIQLARPVNRPNPSLEPTSSPAPTGPQVWLNASRWKGVQVGMGEMEVVSLLGPPTSMRTTGGARVLLYAMEIGSSGFLSGSVTLRDQVVVEVRKPELR